MIKRIFEVLMELDENQVTMSPALVKHMIKHRRRGLQVLRVMPVKAKDKHSGKELVGLDINPPYAVADALYQQSLSEVQYDPKTKLTGFQMEDPTVIGLWNMYGMNIDTDHPENMRCTMWVEARKSGGRWVYWIKPMPKNEAEKEKLRKQVLWTAWLVKMGII